MFLTVQKNLSFKIEVLLNKAQMAATKKPTLCSWSAQK